MEKGCELTPDNCATKADLFHCIEGVGRWGKIKTVSYQPLYDECPFLTLLQCQTELQRQLGNLKIGKCVISTLVIVAYYSGVIVVLLL